MKKLTAGIFTALLGLVTVNAANAAIPSTNYVDTQFQTVTREYEAADRALGTRIDGVESAYKAADTELGGRVTELETTVGEGTMSVNGNTQNDVIAAINALDAKTNGIATNENLDKLQQTVTTHTNSLNVLNGTGEGSVAKAEADAVATANAYTDQLANGQVKTNTGAIAANAVAIEANETAIAGKAAQSDLTALTTRVTTAEGAIGTLASEKADATYVEEQLALKATVASVDAVAEKADNNEAAISNLGTTKLNVSEHEANQVLITDGSGSVTTSATITQGQVDGLSDALAAKMTDVTTVSAAGSEDGVYVLTAKVVGDETTYKWELIERTVPAPM